MIKRVYIAAPLQLETEARLLRRDLTDAGIAVRARWLDGLDKDDEQAAERDLVDIREAHAVVLMNPVRWANLGTGGRHVEVGYAMALKIPVFILGAASNVFHATTHCTIAEHLPELLDKMKRMTTVYRG